VTGDPSEDALQFGDVLSAAWLFDTVVNDDAVGLTETNLRRGALGYVPLPAGAARTGDKDFVLTHGQPCRAVLLADDCEIETCLVRKGGRGRLLFAVLSPWPTDPAEAARASALMSFRRHPLEPKAGFDGGVVELNRLFAVNGRALTDLGAEHRIARLGASVRARLEQRWAAFATRRGPLAARDNATKLAHLLDAGDDAERMDALAAGGAPADQTIEVAKSVTLAFSQAWKAEGEVMQGIADAHEARRAGRAEVSELEQALRSLAAMAASAADALHDASAA
jgi:hypothetical protein